MEISPRNRWLGGQITPALIGKNVAYLFETHLTTSEPHWAYYWSYGHTKYNHNNDKDTNILLTGGQVKTYPQSIDNAINSGTLKVW
jgi:hypothetical protein